MYELQLLESHVPAQADMDIREITVGGLLREVASLRGGAEHAVWINIMPPLGSGICGGSRRARQTFPDNQTRSQVSKFELRRSAVPYLPRAFAQLLNPLDRRMMAGAVDRHNGNRGVGEGDWAWTCQRHLKMLLFAQVAGLTSLRETTEAMAARPSALHHLGLHAPKRSTLSDASAVRPAAIFADVAAI